MKFRFLMENKTFREGILAEHGLSIYIEAQGKKILFDAGDTNLFASNAAKMKVDLGAVDFAVVSHGHHDHTGGFPMFHQINPKAPIYIHRNALRVSYGTEGGALGEGGVLDEQPCSIGWTDKELKGLADQLMFTDGPVEITEDIKLTGTIPYAEGFKPTDHFYCYDGDELLPDDMSHEQCLVIREPEGLYIFSGCSHRGVISALNAGKSMFPGEKVAALIAGMHLYSAKKPDRQRVIDEIAAENIGKVIPVHCTGTDALCELKLMLGDKCVILQAGDEYLV
ncbi:MAG: MBL fold metallo-hydrolase [Firmicutes bacterium]|nr:MBL fold metallo-hydrolase [Bacillota bacterium]